ncbi:thioredoxin-like protein [Xylogone sp. PMI_703]|nr:thioredoxin-like protein [Xylogone sp. PMI_703]
MAPELRKRKAPVEQPPPAPPVQKKGRVAKAVAKVKETVVTKATKDNATSGAPSVAVGSIVSLDGFGGEIETNDGTKTNLKKLVDESTAGVVLFTYPKASTPGCTNQACLFRDSYTSFTASGFSVYGLSKDSTKANTNFKEKQKLQYPLLCDTAGTLISAIGLKKAPNGITRGVFIIDKSGKVLAAQGGSPAGTVDVAKKIVEGLNSTEAPAVVETESKPEETENGTAPITSNGINGTEPAVEPSTADAAVTEAAPQPVDAAKEQDTDEAKKDEE